MLLGSLYLSDSYLYKPYWTKHDFQLDLSGFASTLSTWNGLFNIKHKRSP